MKVVALLMPRALGQVSPSADAVQLTYAAESAALKELYTHCSERTYFSRSVDLRPLHVLWGPPLREQLRGPCAQAEMSPSPRARSVRGPRPTCNGVPRLSRPLVPAYTSCSGMTCSDVTGSLPRTRWCGEASCKRIPCTNGPISPPASPRTQESKS